ncbi:hypothetical protein O1611_g7578 [Lasiodiplodia mahajangana]|uniref:Uncharacterized protein n=1 Tax=Lasiodiplodia mahajangana TaxID=1108764 RepID=A0ACC2JF02_9PEZI|nr:hypothetical protein O1611_g7578 [Lasiodiplodia mahajangana]
MPVFDDVSTVDAVGKGLPGSNGGLNGDSKLTKKGKAWDFSGVQGSASAMVGWPGIIDSRAVWDGSLMTDETYTYTLSALDILEIEAALGHFKDESVHTRASPFAADKLFRPGSRRRRSELRQFPLAKSLKSALFPGE